MVENNIVTPTVPNAQKASFSPSVSGDIILDSRPNNNKLPKLLIGAIIILILIVGLIITIVIISTNKTSVADTFNDYYTYLKFGPEKQEEDAEGARIFALRLLEDREDNYEYRADYARTLKTKAETLQTAINRSEINDSEKLADEIEIISEVLENYINYEKYISENTKEISDIREKVGKYSSTLFLVSEWEYSAAQYYMIANESTGEEKAAAENKISNILVSLFDEKIIARINEYVETTLADMQKNITEVEK